MLISLLFNGHCVETGWPLALSGEPWSSLMTLKIQDTIQNIRVYVVLETCDVILSYCDYWSYRAAVHSIDIS